MSAGMLAVLSTVSPCRCDFCKRHVLKEVSEGYGLRGLPGLRFEREYQRLSRPALAKLSGISEWTIRALEYGERDASGHTAGALAEALDCSVSDLEGIN